ncbi:nSTAND1 domain-containing NTPase [Lentzea chajnantorensis]
MSNEAAIVASQVRQVFTPHQPIRDGEVLAGRSAEIGRLISVLNTPGQHVLLYGERGVGKSSLAIVVSNTYAQAITTVQKFFLKRCDHTDTFESIFHEPLAAVGVDVLRVEYVTQESRTRKKEAKVVDIGFGVEAQSSLAATYRPDGTIGASEAARHLSRLTGFMLIDELDVVSDPLVRKKIAELIKHLSDAGASFKLMLVGIAETAADLTDGHASVQRALRETKLQTMQEGQLRDIVQRGASALGLVFDESVTIAIARLSAGYPHFTHLLALKCAEHVIRAGRKQITMADLPLAMTAAVEDAESTLRHGYTESIRSQSKSYKDALTAAASISDEEFSLAELRKAMNGENPSPMLRKLASEDGSTILKRVSRGIFRFTDPRMRSYIRIIHLMVEPVV